jgi:hypothetical protein
MRPFNLKTYSYICDYEAHCTRGGCQNCYARSVASVHYHTRAVCRVRARQPIITMDTAQCASDSLCCASLSFAGGSHTSCTCDRCSVVPTKALSPAPDAAGYLTMLKLALLPLLVLWGQCPSVCFPVSVSLKIWSIGCSCALRHLADTLNNPAAGGGTRSRSDRRAGIGWRSGHHCCLQPRTGSASV